MNITKEELKLQDLLKEDKEMLLENMAKDRSPEAVRALLENELDRIAYRCSEGTKDERRAWSMQTYIKIIKNTLPFISSVNEVREWKRNVNTSAAKKFRPAAAVAAIAGLALVVIPVIMAITSKEGGLSFRSLPVTLAGAVCLFLGGLLFRARSKEKVPEEELKQEFLVDPAGVYQSLWGAFIITDKCIEDDMVSRDLSGGKAAAVDEDISAVETELLSGLLETAYTHRSQEDAAGNEEMISAIRYYLHNRNIEVVDYTKEQESMFEILPSKRAGTMRPALVCGSRVIKKGLASSAGE